MAYLIVQSLPGFGALSNICRNLKRNCKGLKTNGLFFFTVPFLWPLHDCQHDEFRFTPWSLERLLRDANFDQIEIKSTGGWDHSLAQAIGLWLKRRPMGDYKRSCFRFLFIRFGVLWQIASPTLRYSITIAFLCQECQASPEHGM